MASTRSASYSPSAQLHITDILGRLSQGARRMPTFRRAVPCVSIAAAVLLIGGSHVTGQSASIEEHGRSLAVMGAASTLPGAMARVDAMLRIGELDIASRQDDTMMPGRVHERLKQVFKGLPVFGGQVARQMDGRAI